jgi:hypothetical protein
MARASKSDAKDPATKALFDTYKKSAETLSFRGHRNAPVARVEWEDYYVIIKALPRNRAPKNTISGEQRFEQNPLQAISRLIEFYR